VPVIWGIHNTELSEELTDEGFVSIGWEGLGDLRKIPMEREALKDLLAATYPTAKPGAIPVWAGVLIRFVEEMRIGDLVVSPDKRRRTLNVGTVVSDFYVEPTATRHPNRRRVAWTHLDVPRSVFSRGALHELGSSLTLFRVRRHEAELLDLDVERS
jgi:restriction system protein